MSLEAILALVATAAVLCRAVFSTADAALTGVSPERAEELRSERDDLAHRALASLKKDLEGTAATVRGGAVFSLAVAAALGGVVSLRLLEPFVGTVSWLDPYSSAVIAAAVGGIVAAALSFVELLPRSLAVAGPERWAVRLALPVRVASLPIAPLARGFKALVDRILRPVGATATFRHAPPALEDIERILEQESKTDEDAPPADLVRGLFEFSTKIAREVMVPRTRVVGVPLDAGPDEVLRVLAEEGHSRMPVYRGSIDDIVGVLHTRDLVPLLAHPELIKIVDAIRPAVFVPWGTRIGHLLREMQRRRIHMAMVTDEFGGFMGIVTLEDILEEIVGDIRDEHDEPEPRDVDPQPDGTFLVTAGILVGAFNEAVGAELPEDQGYETLAGFLNHVAGEIPEVGATVQSHGGRGAGAGRPPPRGRRGRGARVPAAADEAKPPAARDGAAPVAGPPEPGPR